MRLSRTVQMDALEQQVLRVGGEYGSTLPVHGWFARVETARARFDQRGNPRGRQAQRRIADAGTSARRALRLELQYLWLIDLVHHAAVNPRQPPRPRVEAGRRMTAC
jgi:hypothetical protein